MLLLALLACQEPFGTDRHDLDGFRIVALSVEVDGDAVVPSPALVVDGRPWSDDPVALRWYWLDAPDDLVDADLLEPVATGPAPRLAREGDLLGLVAVAPDGTERAAFLEMTDATIGPLTVSQEVLPLTVGDVTAPELDVDRRRGLTTEPGPIPVGGFARLRLAPEVRRTRWTATDGTFFELDPVTADWAAGRVRVDDDEVVTREPLDPGLVTVIALALDDATAWTAVDLAVGPPPVGVSVHGRFLPADVALSGTIEATLVADDTSPTGLRLVDVVPGSGSWGTSELPCRGPVDGPFDPRWLLDGRCARREVAGARVGLRVDE